MSIAHDRPDPPPVTERYLGWIFDLDGTLVDSAPDLLAALGRVLDHAGRSRDRLASARALVSHGADAMLAHVFPDLDTTARAPLRARFLDDYAACAGDASRPFPGVDRLIDALDAQGTPWGIVTNKPERFTAPLLERLGLDRRARVVVCGDTLAQAKPHPAPMQHAARILGIPAARCLALGDAQRDIAAARAAGMVSAVAGWGYFGAGDRPETWGADLQLDSPQAALDLLSAPAPTST